MTFEAPGGPGGPRAGRPDPSGGERFEDGDAAPWWEDHRGWNADDAWAPFPRRRRSKFLQLTGVVVAVTLVLGTAGSTLVIVLGGSSPQALPAEVASVVPLPAAGASVPVRVAFQVENPTGGSVRPACTVSVLRGDQVVATVPVRASSLGEMAARTLAADQVVADVGRTVLAGVRPGASVACHS
jgi:hypothetical protein